MPQIESSDFGPVTFEDSEVYSFPDGLHGFEESKEFLLLQREGLSPFCFLQSISDGALRFICLPARMADAEFVVEIGPDEASQLTIPAGKYGPATTGIHVLAILTIPEHSPPTANLFAPVVLVPAARRGGQCIQFGSNSRASHPIPWMAKRDPQAAA